MTGKFPLAKIFIALSLCALSAAAQTSIFTYQGSLTDGSMSANGQYDFTFKLFDSLTNGTQIGTDEIVDNVLVTAGSFKVQLDFGTGAFTPGLSRFLEIHVRPGASTGAYTLLSPRQQITSSPFAVKSRKASDSDLFGGQLPSAFGTAAQVALLQAQNSALQSQITQLQSELVATTGGTQLWSRGIGGSSSELGNAVAVDSNGDVFVTGFFNGTVNFGGGNLVSAGGDDIFVAKYSGATGAYIWAKRFGSGSSEEGNCLATDAAGNVFVTGQFFGTFDFGGPPLNSAGMEDIFLAKLSGADGSHLWSRRFGSTGIDIGNSIAVDGTGNPVISGVFISTVDFGGVPIATNGANDIFVAKYNGVTNAHIWSKGFGGTSPDQGEGVAFDSSGNIIVTGTYNSSSISFGGTALTNAGNSDVFIAKLASADASHIWSKSFGGSNNDFGNSVAADGVGGVFLLGIFTSTTIDLGGGPRANAGTNDVFLAKFNSAGTHQWSIAAGGTGFDAATGVALDSLDNPIIVGSFQNTTNLGGASLNSAGSNDCFVAKYAGTTGLHQWSRRFGDTGFEQGRALATNSTGDFFLTGHYSSTTLEFGGGPLSNIGLADIFVAKLKK